MTLKWWCPQCGSRNPNHVMSGPICRRMRQERTTEDHAFERGDGKRIERTPNLEEYDNGKLPDRD